MKISSKITSGILAAVMAFSPFVSSISVIAAEIEETEPSTSYVEIVETEESDVIVTEETTVETVADYEEPVETTVPDEEIVISDDPVETIDDTAPPAETEEVIIVDDETEETVLPEETEIEEPEDIPSNIIIANSADEFAEYMSTLPGTERIIINTTDDLSILNADYGVYYDGTYVIGFVEQPSYDNAIAYCVISGYQFAIDGDMSVCGTGSLISYAEINPSATTRVAVIDTGSNLANESYSVIGYDVNDYNGHGTAMSNIILENTNDAYIISIKALGDDGHGEMSNVYAAIQYAMDMNVDVILLAMSMRNNGNCDAFSALIAEAQANGITVIASAGNNNTDAYAYIPASFSGVITVGALNSDLTKNALSNYGGAVNYYVVESSTSNAAAKFVGMYISDNYEAAYTEFLDDEPEVSDGEWEVAEDYFEVNGTGEMTWLSADTINALGYSSSDEFRDAVINASSSMLGGYYASDSNGWGNNRVDCITFVNRAYAQPLGLISGLSVSNHSISYSGLTGFNSTYGLWTQTGMDSVSSWANRNPHAIGNGGVRVTSLSASLSELHAQRGDIVIFGRYNTQYSYTYTVTTSTTGNTANRQTDWYNSESAAKSAAQNAIAGSQYHSGSLGSCKTREGSDFTWTHAAIYAGTGTMFYEAYSSDAYVELRSRSDAPSSSGNKGYNRIAVLHIENFERPTVISFHKSSTNPGIVNNRLYSLDGTTYGVYLDPTCSELAATMIFNADGTVRQIDRTPTWVETAYNMQIVTDDAGHPAIQVRRNCPNLYMREISAGRGYSLNSEIRTIICNGSQTVEFTDAPDGDPLSVSIQKIDPESLNVVPGVYDFSGAQYTVYYYDTVNVSSASQGLALLSGTPWAQMTFTAGSNGRVSITPENFQACRASSTNMLYGTYVIRETNAPTGFNMPEDSNQCIVYVLRENGTRDCYVSTPSGSIRPAFEVVTNSDSIRATETRQIGFINFQKVLRNTTPVNGFTFGSSLNGTVYEIYVDANRNGTLETNERNANALIATVTLDENGNVKTVRYSNFNPEIGYITSRNIFELPRGYYVATETVAPECSFFGPDVAITVDENHLVDRTIAQNNPAQIPTAKIINVQATDPYATIRFDFVLNKVASDGTRMHGATYTLYSDEACTNAICTITEDGSTGVYRANYSFIYTPNSSTLREGIYYYDFSSTYYLRETGAATSFTDANGRAVAYSSSNMNHIVDPNVYTVNVSVNNVSQSTRRGTLTYSVNGETLENPITGSFANYHAESSYVDNKITLANAESQWVETAGELSLVKRTETESLGSGIPGFDVTSTVFTVYAGDRETGTLIATYKYANGAWHWYDMNNQMISDSVFRALAFDTTYTVYENFDTRYFRNGVYDMDVIEDAIEAIENGSGEDYASIGIPYTVENTTEGWVQVNATCWSFTFTTPAKAALSRQFNYGATNNLTYGTIDVTKVWVQSDTEDQDLSGYTFAFEYGGDGDVAYWEMDDYSERTHTYILRDTDENGNIHLENIPCGWYRVGEYEDGYRVVWNGTDDVFKVIHLRNRATLRYTCINIVRITITVDKIDEWTNQPVTVDPFTGEEVPYGGNRNVSFILYPDVNDNGILDEFEMQSPDENAVNRPLRSEDFDRNGRIQFVDLGVGRYFLVEENSPWGYYLPVEVTTIEVAEAHDIDLEISNTPYSASVTVHKLDIDTELPLEGAEFTVYVDMNENGIYDEGIDTIATTYDEETETLVPATVTWDAETSTYVTSNLRAGHYVIVETKTPTGYFYTDENGKPTTTPNQAAIEILDLDPVTQSELILNTTYEATLLNVKPTVRTELIDSSSSSHIGSLGTEVELVDTVSYSNVLPGIEYELRGQLLNRSTGEVIAEATVRFTPDETDGETQVVFVVDSSELCEGGQPVGVVAFEQLWGPEDWTDDECEDEIMYASHEDIQDQSQSVDFNPEVRTTFLDGQTRLHEACVAHDVNLVDVVSYSNLIVGETYTVNGQVIDKVTNEVIAENSVTFVAETTSGTVEVPFVVNTANLVSFATDENGVRVAQPRQIVAFERLTSESGYEFCVHADINDNDQTITVVPPEVHTTAIDGTIGTHVMTYTETVTIVDEVEFTNLVVGETYSVTGTLMDKTTGLPYVGPNGETYTKTVEFEATISNGAIAVVFENVLVPYTVTSVVVFEELRLLPDNTLIGIHMDLNDDNQTVKRPQAGTTATIDGAKEIYLGSSEVRNITITDTIAYSNLEPGYVYRAEATLYMADGTQVTNEAGVPIVATLEFVPETANGTVDVNITFSTAGMTDGTRVVVFEKVYYSAKNSNCENGGPTEDVLIAVHEDLNDAGQTVTIHYRPSTGEVASKVGVVGVILLVTSLGFIVIRKKKET